MRDGGSFDLAMEGSTTPVMMHHNPGNCAAQGATCMQPARKKPNVRFRIPT